MSAQTRGFLFSDLRGYSAFTERQGDQAARALLARYRGIVREAVGRYGGAEIRTEGDSFYVVFDSVSQAVEAGVAIQTALSEADGESINAGIGIHAGEVEDDAEHGIVSSAVNIAARICAVADPGEVLVSDTVRALTRGYLDVVFLSRGRRKLKGITDPVTLYRAQTADASPQARPSLGSLRLPPFPLALGFVVALLFASLVVATMIREGVGSVVDDPSSPGRAPESLAPAPLPSAASASNVPSQSESTPSAPPYPTEAENRLLRLISDELQRQCQRAAFEDGPVWLAYGARDDPPERQFVPAAAGIECHWAGISTPDALQLWELPIQPLGRDGPDGPVELLNQIGGRAHAGGASCATEVPAIEIWNYGSSSGRLLCYETATGDAVIWWTYDGTNLLAHAIRDDRDLPALMEWWNRTARFGP